MVAFTVYFICQPGGLAVTGTLTDPDAGLTDATGFVTLTTIRDYGSYRNYQYGAVIEAPSAYLYVSRGAIRSEWGALGFESGVMGYPSTDEVGGLVNGGVYQNYDGGAIVWSPTNGSHESLGATRSEWQAMGFENGLLGYPTTDEVGGLVNGGAYQNYDGGAIVWSPATGAHETDGVLRGAWQSTGFENGRLGYPTSDPYAIPNGTAQNFQGGRIADINGAITIS